MSSFVIIARPEHTVALRKRLSLPPDVLFPDTDALQAIDAILGRRPRVVVLDHAFANTARGAALVARVKSELQLAATEVRVLIEDEERMPLVLTMSATAPEKALIDTSRPLDHAGTRRAVRFPMNRRNVMVNGEPSELVDLSVTGAQVVVTTRLRPNEVLRLVLTDGAIDARCQGTVIWSVALLEQRAMQYRAGVEFVTPDTATLETFCRRHGGRPDPTFGAV